MNKTNWILTILLIIMITYNIYISLPVEEDNTRKDWGQKGECNKLYTFTVINKMSNTTSISWYGGCKV